MPDTKEVCTVCFHLYEDQKQQNSSPSLAHRISVTFGELVSSIERVEQGESASEILIMIQTLDLCAS